MKLLIKFFIILCLIFLYSCNKQLPYGLKLFDHGMSHSISDSLGHSIIEEGFEIGFHKNQPIVESLIMYTTNELGLVIYLKTQQEEFVYVAIKPKKNQKYPQLEVNYTIYKKAKYLNLGYNDKWTKINALWW